MRIDRKEAEILKDMIDDLKEENKMLKQMLTPRVAQFKSQSRTNAPVQWDITTIKSPMIDNNEMVTIGNDNKDIIIGVSGLYNIIIRFGYESRCASTNSKYDIKVNDQIIASQRINGSANATAAPVCFNEYVKLEKGDHIQFINSCGHTWNTTLNHFTLIRIPQ